MKDCHCIKILLIALVLNLASNCCNAQLTDTLQAKKISRSRQLVRQFGIPVTLIGLGIYGTGDHQIINRAEIKEERGEHFPHFKNHLDNYMQFGPLPFVYAYDAIGLKGTNDWKQQTILLAKAQVMMMAMVVPIKKYTHILRPDSSGYTSFPSGHTAQAFMGATFFYKEFGKAHPWASAGMFMMAGGVGAFRILNNRHWISDVLAGAGIGILATEFSYLTQSKHHKQRKLQPEVVLPSYEHGAYVCTALFRL